MRGEGGRGEEPKSNTGLLLVERMNRIPPLTSEPLLESFQKHTVNQNKLHTEVSAHLCSVFPLPV